MVSGPSTPPVFSYSASESFGSGSGWLIGRAADWGIALIGCYIFASFTHTVLLKELLTCGMLCKIMFLC